jgi:hypothetical protein
MTAPTTFFIVFEGDPTQKKSAEPSVSTIVESTHDKTSAVTAADATIKL